MTRSVLLAAAPLLLAVLAAGPALSFMFTHQQLVDAKG
jgi:hypothetical protein